MPPMADGQSETAQGLNDARAGACEENRLT